MKYNVTFVVVIFVYVCVVVLSEGQLMSKEHRTHAASERTNNLSCFQCNSMDVENCRNLTEDTSSLERKCNNEKRICMVKQFSYTTSTANSTSAPMLWALERNCATKCEPGCIIIGERTKLYACTTCCETSLCNIGRGVAVQHSAREAELVFAIALQILSTVILLPSCQ